MRLGRNKEIQDKLERDRQKVINYKKTFATPDGREVLFDLMNRYFILEGVPEGDRAIRCLGQNDVAKYILKMANIDLVEFEKLLKGEING